MELRKAVAAPARGRTQLSLCRLGVRARHGPFQKPRAGTAVIAARFSLKHSPMWLARAGPIFEGTATYGRLHKRQSTVGVKPPLQLEHRDSTADTVRDWVVDMPSVKALTRLVHEIIKHKGTEGLLPRPLLRGTPRTGLGLHGRQTTRPQLRESPAKRQALALSKRAAGRASEARAPLDLPRGK